MEEIEGKGFSRHMKVMDLTFNPIKQAPSNQIRRKYPKIKVIGLKGSLCKI